MIESIEHGSSIHPNLYNNHWPKSRVVCRELDEGPLSNHVQEVKLAIVHIRRQI